MKGIVSLISSALTFFSPPVVAAATTMVGLGVESFVWQEFDSDGSKLLEESGPRYVLTFQYQSALEDHWSYHFNADFYMGNVDYDGQTQSGTPITTTSEYSGLRGDLLATYHFGEDPVPLFGIMGGIGLDSWSRKLRDTTTSGGTPVSGYKEVYFMIYGKLGLQLQFGSEAWQQKLKGGLRRPLYVTESVDELDVTLEPKPTTTFFAAWEHVWKLDGVDERTLGLNIYYEHTRFDESDPELSNIGYVLQPESDMEIIGAKLLYSF